MKNWNQRCMDSIKREKAEVEKRYGIRISQTEIYCAICGKGWPYGCIHSPREEIKYNSPTRSLDDYREELGIKIGMSKEEALEKFRTWRERMKTCERCEGEKYIEFCPMHLICKEADNEQQDVGGNDHRSRIDELNEVEGIRTRIFKNRQRTPIRETVKNEAGLP